MRCAECGYDYAGPERTELAGALRALGPRFDAVLRNHSGETLRERVRPDIWSPLEYACHVRDVLQVQRERVLLALAEDEPEFVPMRRDERAIELGYNGQEPGAVANQLAAAANALAATLDGLDTAGWSRTGLYNYPEPAHRTVDWIGRHTVHEGLHHLRDVTRQLPASSGPAA